MFTLKVNGSTHRLDVSPESPLLWVLRDQLGLKGVKYGCGIGECGTCTVLVDGKAERSCTITAGSVEGSEITTIEGLPEDHPIKEAWIKEQVPQCGYCQPGIMLQALDFLTRKPGASESQMAEAMDDVICRCGTHPKIMKAMKSVAGKLKTKEGTQ